MGGRGVGRRGRGGERRRRNGMAGDRRSGRIGREKELEGKRGGEVGMWRQVEWRGQKEVRSRVSLAPLCCSLPPPLSFKAGLFNFRPAVRPVPLETHIHGFPTKQYCPRMATMNKPAYTAICTHSPRKPVLIFVASRRQTRLTAQALIGFLATTESPKQWLHLPEDEVCPISEHTLCHVSLFGVVMSLFCLAAGATALTGPGIQFEIYTWFWHWTASCRFEGTGS